METVIAGLALKFGGRLLKSVFGGSFGKKFGEHAAEKVVDKVTELVLGKTGAKDTSDLNNLSEERLREIFKDIEGELPKIVAEFTTSTKNSLDFQKTEMLREEPKESFFIWGWRPVGMWMLISALIHYIFFVPVINIFTERYELIFNVRDLLTVCGLFFSLYMGGHTVKYVADSFKSQKRDEESK